MWLHPSSSPPPGHPGLQESPALGNLMLSPEQSASSAAALKLSALHAQTMSYDQIHSADGLVVSPPTAPQQPSAPKETFVGLAGNHGLDVVAAATEAAPSNMRLRNAHSTSSSSSLSSSSSSSIFRSPAPPAAPPLSSDSPPQLQQQHHHHHHHQEKAPETNDDDEAVPPLTAAAMVARALTVATWVVAAVVSSTSGHHKALAAHHRTTSR